jgi:hypothetical protein
MMIGKDFTLAPGDRPGELLVKRITTRGEEKRVAMNRVDDVLTSLTELKASYPDMVDFLRKAHDYQRVNCPIVPWSVPETTLQTLIETGRQMKSGA